MSQDQSESSSAPLATAKPTPSRRPQPQQLPPYNVVLLDDDDHTFDYVIEMLRALFAHPEEMGMLLARQVDRTGRAIVCTTHKEKAEWKRDQITGYGADARIAGCAGSMSALIEPADEQ